MWSGGSRFVPVLAGNGAGPPRFPVRDQKKFWSCGLGKILAKLIWLDPLKSPTDFRFSAASVLELN